MSSVEIKQALEFAASFLIHQSYQSLTHALLDYFNTLEGVTDVASYEVFGTALNDKTISLRRFPLTLNERFTDKNTVLLTSFILNSNGGVTTTINQHDNWIFIDVINNVKPRRVILIQGRVDVDQMNIIEGLYSVYANQVALLDSKERDVLTSLPNRQTLETTLHDILVFYRQRKLEKDPKHSWIAVLDIDHFKNINDQFGHLYGDEVLVHFSNLMETSFRHTDFLFRYGGEEFVVIINNADSAEATHVFDSFRKKVESFDFPSGKVTVSIGFTLIDPDAPQSLLIENADRAVYEAKNNGRNQVVMADYTNANPSPNFGEIDMF